MHSLFRFLRISPFDRKAQFQRHVAGPILAGEPDGARNFRLILESICLRRTKALLHLPDADHRTFELALSEEEKARYADIIAQSRETIDEAISSKSTTKAYNGILQAILRLRLLCNHGTLERQEKATPPRTPSLENDEELLRLQQGDEAICAYCSCDLASSTAQASITPRSVTACSHILCSGCSPLYEAASRHAQGSLESVCPICSQAMGTEHGLEPNSMLQENSFSCSTPLPPIENTITQGHSSKLSALLNDIAEHCRYTKWWVSYSSTH